MNGLEIAKGIVDVYTTSNHKCLDNDWVYYWVDAKAYIENGIFVGLNDFNLSDEETMHVAEENDERIVLKNEKGRHIHFIYKNKNSTDNKKPRGQWYHRRINSRNCGWNHNI